MPEYKNVNPNDIIVPEGRFRKNFADIEGLKASILSQGMLNAIIVDEKMVLIAGERRLKAALEGKVEEVPVKIYSNLSPEDYVIMEAMENVQRENFTWTEEVAIHTHIHRELLKIHGQKGSGPNQTDSKGWTLEKTAKILGISITRLWQDFKLANYLPLYPELAKYNRSNALDRADAMRERDLENELAIRASAVTRAIDKATTTPQKHKKLTIPVEDSDDVFHPSKGIPFRLHLGDIRDFVKTISDDVVDLVIIDPPYGIQIEESIDLSRRQTFTDHWAYSRSILEQVIPECYRIMKNDRIMIVFFAIQEYEFLKNLLINNNFTVRDVPFIWNKLSGGAGDTSKQIPHAYEAAMFCHKGLYRAPNQFLTDMLSFQRPPTSERKHPTQKPVDMIQFLIETFTHPNELVFDGFSGAFTTGLASLLSHRFFLGSELESEFFGFGCSRMEEFYVQFCKDTLKLPIPAMWELQELLVKCREEAGFKDERTEGEKEVLPA